MSCRFQPNPSQRSSNQKVFQNFFFALLTRLQPDVHDANHDLGSLALGKYAGRAKEAFG
jgi:hypothetical protein